MARKSAKVTIDLDVGLLAELKALAVERETTVAGLCRQAVENEVREARKPHLSWRTDPVLAQLWDNEDDAVYDDI